MVYPRVSYVTNMGETGLHSKTDFRQFHTSFQHGSKKLILSGFDQSESIYDIFFEYSSDLIRKKNSDLSCYDFETDIRGLRLEYKKEYVLTSRPVSSPILTFSNAFRPQEVNALFGNEGSEVRLAKAVNVIKDDKYKRNRIVDDILCANYNLGIREAIDCLIYLIKKKFF